jgi:hypothetical protein
VPDALTSLFAAFFFVGGLGMTFVLLSMIADFRDDRRPKAQVMKWKPGTLVYRKEDPWTKCQVLKPSGPWIRLQGPEGRRLLLSEQRFRDDFIAPP